MLRRFGLAILLPLAVVLGACSAPVAPTATPLGVAQVAPASPTVAAPATSTTIAPPTATAVPATATRAATATSTPAPTATATATRVPAQAAAGGDVLSKMKNIRNFSADLTVEAEGGEAMEGKIAFSNGKMRLDLEAMGLTMSIYIDPVNKVGYMYTPETKSALGMPYEQATDQSTDPSEMLDWEKNATAPPKLLRQETVDGKPCSVYEFTTADGKSTSWLDNATGFPLKNEAADEDGQLVTTHFTNVKVNDVDESEVTLPAGTEILDLSGLMATPIADGAPRATTTPVRVWPTPVAGQAGGLRPAAISVAVPDVLKDSVPIPRNFTLVPYSGGRMDDLDEDTFRASAQFTGDASMQALADFYEYVLAEGWQLWDLTAEDTTLVMIFEQIDSEPVVTLYVEAEEGDDGVTLTLTISNEPS